MESYKVIKKAINEIGVKSIAHDMGLSSSLIYKWCQSEYSGGADNPLDRLVKLYKLTGSKEIIYWVCEQAGGFFIENQNQEDISEELLKTTQKILKEFSELLNAISLSTADDGIIDKGEAKNIRSEWEDLKRVTEAFVSACEKGVFNEDA